MAGNIQNVNIQQLKTTIAHYDELCKTLQEKTRGIRADIQIISQDNYWSGKRMNEIVTECNKMCEQAYYSLKFFCTDISGVLNEILQQYQALEDEGIARNISIDVNESFHYLLTTPLKLTDETKLVFNQERITSYQNLMNNNLKACVQASQDLVTCLNSIEECSDSLSSLMTKYKAESASLSNSFESMLTTFTTQVNEAIKTVQTTEGYNEDDVGRIK